MASKVPIVIGSAEPQDLEQLQTGDSLICGFAFTVGTSSGALTINGTDGLNLQGGGNTGFSLNTSGQISTVTLTFSPTAHAISIAQSAVTVNGGGLTITCGKGGNASSGDAGNGGATVIAAGQGGSSDGTDAAGDGGAVQFSAGQGGSGSGAINPGDGATFSILGGNGGTGGGGVANGGGVTVRGGAKTGSGTDGVITIGDVNTSAINIGVSSITTAIAGTLSGTGTAISFPTSAVVVTIGGGATAGKLKFMEPSGSGSNYTTFAAQAQAASIDYLLPAAAPSAGQKLHSGSTGTLLWVDDAMVFEARMQRDSTTQVSLQRYKGQRIWINGELIDPGSGGFACVTSDNLIAADGTDSGGAMGTSTLYYMYVSNASASFAASDLRGSTTAPSTFNGVKYLATSGNGANWRFVGWVRTNGSTQFSDDTTNRLVVNYYNRLRLSLRANPAYADDNTPTTYTETSTSFTQANGGTGGTLSWIANGEDAADLTLSGLASNNTLAASNIMGIGIDSTTTAYSANLVSQPVANYVVAFGCSYKQIPAEGYHTAELLVMVSSGTMTVRADMGRGGGSADARCTMIEGHVWG